MRRALVALVGTALALSMIPVTAGAVSPAPFSGTWTSVDVDGSVQFLSITNSTKPKVVLVDTYASYCAKHGAQSPLFAGSGAGTFKGTTQLAVKVGKAACGSFKVPLSILAGLTYTWAPGPNTLTDTFGVTWHPYAAAAARHVAGNFVGSAGDPVISGMMLFEVKAGPTGALQSGYYTFNAMTGPADWAGNRTQATVDTIRFFTAASGAPAAEFTGWECVLAKALAAPDPVGTCGHYRIIVTDGASLGLADTFCGGKADVTDPSNALYCPYVWKVEKGDIRIYSGT
jgi:hypothetical protein